MNITLVDVVYDGHGYMLEATTKAAGTNVIRASRRVACSPRGCGNPIPRGECYLYLRGEGRLCVRCARLLGALEIVDQPADVRP